METRAWFQCYGNKVSHDVRNDLSRSLRELGISLLPDVHDSALPLGVIFVGEFDEGLLRVSHGIKSTGVEARPHGHGVRRASKQERGMEDPARWSFRCLDLAEQRKCGSVHCGSTESMGPGGITHDGPLCPQPPHWTKPGLEGHGTAGGRDCALVGCFPTHSRRKRNGQGTGSALDPCPRSEGKQKGVGPAGLRTLAPELAGSEFFGHERGAFTGAVDARDGAFALADGGTLFLDEIGELPLPSASPAAAGGAGAHLQAGGWQRLATNRLPARLRHPSGSDAQSAERGDFRADLYYRIAAWICRLPPLRERREDILPLARHFLEEFEADDAPRLDRARARVSARRRDYPGNVRDLRQLVCRIGHRHVGAGADHPGRRARRGAAQPAVAALRLATTGFDGAIRLALDARGRVEGHRQPATRQRRSGSPSSEEDGNLQRAANRLGVTDRALQMRRANRQSND